MADSDAPGAPDHAESMGDALLRALLIVGAVLVLVWLASMVSLVLLLGFAAAVFAIALNGPVTWLELRGVPRTLGTFAMLLAITIFMSAIVLLIGSKLVEQAAQLVDATPEYLEALEERSDQIIGDYPEVDAKFEPNDPNSSLRTVLPQVGEIATRVGRFSLGVAALVVLFITWVTVVVYLVLEPRSMLRGLLSISPVGERYAVERTFGVFARMVMGWLWANVFVGITEGALVAIYLSFIDVPGAYVWAVLAMVAVFIPKIGAWIMAIPPFLITVATDPTLALWIVLFYVVMNEIMSDVVLPRVQGHGMKVHPAYLVIFVLGFASAFGLLGAVIATPFAGMVSAIWTEFILSRRPPVDHLEERVDQMLRAATDPPR